MSNTIIEKICKILKKYDLKKYHVNLSSEYISLYIHDKTHVINVFNFKNADGTDGAYVYFYINDKNVHFDDIQDLEKTVVFLLHM